ncbi:MAG: UDP-N-acetylmuramate dehydrogenase [Muribaculaceae bacterium]|nr:UDP-N-acetylmuramate dehydrogenase [Muribaculaceae bacterium]
MNIERNKDITPLTTFGIPVSASLFAEYKDVKELVALCRSEEYRENQVLHIGGGSNLLFVNDFDGLILHSAIRGIKVYEKDESTVYVIAGAGEKWVDLVDYCVAHGYAGMENMAGIPGEVGASPVQNVGAYGVEAKDVIYSVECLDRESLKTVTLKNDECGFSYRDSNFKTIWKERYYVLRVAFRLRRSNEARNVNYGSLRQLREETHGRTILISEVRDFVLQIRGSKLPDPADIGSAGSFFKNPVVRRKYYEWEMLNHDASIPHYDIEGDEEHVKIPAGWLIEHAGLKGYAVGGAEVYPSNCLVLVNSGGATAEDVTSLARHIRRKVNECFHVTLEPEVNYIDTSITVTILGSGTSKGVPELMCDCGVCRSENPLDHRLRASILVETMGLTLLIDASPDFRYQALNADLRHIDGVLLTHEHYDHVGGIDDLRPYCMLRPVDMYMKEDVKCHLMQRLEYCFRSEKYPGVPSFEIHEVSASSPFFIKGVEILPVEVHHGKLPILGYRIGKFAYITDAKTISEEEKEKLQGLDVLIVNALRERPHFAHFTIAEALALIAEVKPKRAYLTHLCHETGHHHVFDAQLPPDVSPAYDGQIIHIP